MSSWIVSKIPGVDCWKGVPHGDPDYGLSDTDILYGPDAATVLSQIKTSEEVDHNILKEAARRDAFRKAELDTIVSMLVKSGFESSFTFTQNDLDRHLGGWIT